MKTDVDEDQIEPYMAEINRQFEYIDKEDIIKKMVTITFGKFLDYYKNAPEIIKPETGKAPVAVKAVEAVAKAVARFPMVAESMRQRLVSSACSLIWVRRMVSIRAKSCSI